MLARRDRVIRAVTAVIVLYVGTHFLLFPSGQERFWGPFYIVAGMISAIAALHPQPPQQETHCNKENLTPLGKSEATILAQEI